MEAKEGFEFSLWGGDIHGKNIEVVPNKKLVQDWMSGKWEDYSKVTFTLSGQDNKTKIDLLHENIPNNEAKEIEDGWKRYYLGPLKKLLENS